MKEEKLKRLLNIVIENYISKGDPIGSKFLHSLDDTDYAPSTLRKYLHILEKEGLLYQPYHSAGRIPTVKGLESYMDNVLALYEREPLDTIHVDLDYARDDLQSIVEILGEYADGAAVGFLREDEYYYLGLDNLLKESLVDDYETIKYIIKFIESKELINTLDKRIVKKGNVYHTFIENGQKIVSIVYITVDINGYRALLAILGPFRVDHKKNIALLKKISEECG